MKISIPRICALALAITGLAIGAGCKADVPVYANSPPPAVVEQPGPAPEPALEPPMPLAEPAAAVAANTITNGLPDGTNAANVKLVQAPVVPEELQVSPRLAQVAKLIQAGVKEEVMLAYISNAPVAFNLTSDELVYLNDLGASSAVMTALIQHDNSPEFLNRKQAENAEPAPAPAPAAAPAAVPAGSAPSVAVPPAGQNGELPPAYQEAPPATAYADAAPPTQPVTVNYFYNSLSPYGSWVQVPEYGMCWQPTVAVADPYWRPYAQGGRWLWTDYGWYWYSDYSWGWAPFHYGRWTSYPRLGWVWVPDTYWGPSWVTWRYTDAYYGWAPLPPGCAVSGFGLSYHSGAVGFGFEFGLAPYWYTYVDYRHFHHRHPYRYALPYHQAYDIHRHSRVANDYHFSRHAGGIRVVNNGVGLNHVVQRGGVSIPKTTVERRGAFTVIPVGKQERLQAKGSSTVVVSPELPKTPPAVRTAALGNTSKFTPIPVSKGTAPATETRTAPVERNLAGGGVAKNSPAGGSIATVTPTALNSPVAAQNLTTSASATRPAPVSRPATGVNGIKATPQPSAPEPVPAASSVTQPATVKAPPAARSPSAVPKAVTTPSTVRPAPEAKSAPLLRSPGSESSAPSKPRSVETMRPQTPQPVPTVVPRPTTPSTPAARPVRPTPATSATISQASPLNAPVFAQPQPGRTQPARPAPAAAPSAVPSVIRPAPAAPAIPAARSFAAPPAPSAPAAPAAGSYSAPTIPRPVQAPSYSAPSRPTPAPSYSAPSRPTPAPSYSAPSRPAPAPSYSAPSRPMPTPSYSAPSRPAPAPSYSAPSRPAPAPSSPPSRGQNFGGNRRNNR